jgi:hypothetical protein
MTDPQKITHKKFSDVDFDAETKLSGKTSYNKQNKSTCTISIFTEQKKAGSFMNRP